MSFPTSIRHFYISQSKRKLNMPIFVKCSGLKFSSKGSMPEEAKDPKTE